VTIFEKALGPDHPDVAASRRPGHGGDRHGLCRVCANATQCRYV
jgi:hypothetical protein